MRQYVSYNKSMKCTIIVILSEDYTPYKIRIVPMVKE
jgi:hypothetical protein